MAAADAPQQRFSLHGHGAFGGRELQGGSDLIARLVFFEEPLLESLPGLEVGPHVFKAGVWQ